MATMYKTPGVFLEEIPKFPPSIAAGETAIPAFVGNTQIADRISPLDLLNIPVKIKSLPEYEQYFGVGGVPTIGNVEVDENKNFKKATVGSVYYMYDSLRLFYANGGGDCYVVSVGTYESPAASLLDYTDVDRGTYTLQKVDEPTILVFPDSTLLTDDSHFYGVYANALQQCSDLKDRFGLFQVREDDPRGEDFRTGIGINNLKYGAVYSPWLIINFPKRFTYRDFNTVIKVGTTPRKLVDLTDEPGVKDLINQFEETMVDVDTVQAASNTLDDNSKSLQEEYDSFKADYTANKDVTTFSALLNYIFKIARQLDVLVNAGPGNVKNADVKASIESLISSELKSIYSPLIAYDKELLAANLSGYSLLHTVVTVPTSNKWDDIFDTGSPNASTELTILPANPVPTDANKYDVFVPKLNEAFDMISRAWYKNVVGGTKEWESIKHDGLINSFPLYKSIIAGIQNTSTSVPPSGAVAGIYALVDRTRGVWKSPANVSLTAVVGPKDSFTASELDALNVDPGSGKSINVIRSFTGRGTLVYGARTLAGNDNEWRYVSVRRFFNMVEESTKKATEQFVFEPNDANTWVRVQAMIENFLTVLWRNGALQGAKPGHAFYVAVGLNKTMTPQDILEGKMIVEIGLAVVRPAEFIVLRFSHMLATS